MEINTSTRNLSIVVLRCLSIFAFIISINNYANKVQYLFFVIPNENDLYVAMQVMIPPLLLVVGGILLWIAAPIIARLMCKPFQTEAPSGLASEDIQMIAFSAIGLFLLADVLPDIVQFMV